MSTRNQSGALAVNSDQIASIFNAGVGEKNQTRVEGGKNEPMFIPCEESYDLIYYKEDYASSALHEIAHWCIAGSNRRKLVDYGYWYKETRNLDEQKEFEFCEAKPQALEWIFSEAAGMRYRVSVDNFSQIDTGCLGFREAVRNEALSRINCLSGRALSFLVDLVSESGKKEALARETYEMIPAC